MSGEGGERESGSERASGTRAVVDKLPLVLDLVDVVVLMVLSAFVCSSSSTCSIFGSRER